MGDPVLFAGDGGTEDMDDSSSSSFRTRRNCAERNWDNRSPPPAAAETDLARGDTEREDVLLSSSPS